MQGNVNTLSNTFTMAYFHPTYHHRNVIALRMQAANITGFGGREVPPNNRFYLGGEQDVRGYEFYTISPFVFIPYATTTDVQFFNPQHLNQAGQPTLETLPVNVLEYVPTRPGGDLQGVFNAEYRIPIVKSYVDDEFVQRSGLERDGAASADRSFRDCARCSKQYPNSGFPEHADRDESADRQGNEFPAAHVRPESSSISRFRSFRRRFESITRTITCA